MYPKSAGKGREIDFLWGFKLVGDGASNNKRLKFNEFAKFTVLQMGKNSFSLRFFDSCQTSKKEVFSKMFNTF